MALGRPKVALILTEEERVRLDSLATATTFVSEGSATSPRSCIKLRVGRRHPSKKGDGQENRRLSRFRSDFSTDRMKNSPSVPKSVPKPVCPKRVCADGTKHGCGCI